MDVIDARQRGRRVRGTVEIEPDILRIGGTGDDQPLDRRAYRRRRRCQLGAPANGGQGVAGERAGLELSSLAAVDD